MAYPSRAQGPIATWNRKPSAARRVSLFGFAGALGAYFAFTLLVAPAVVSQEREQARSAVQRVYEAAVDGRYDSLLFTHVASPTVIDTLREWNRDDGFIDRFSVMTFDSQPTGYPMSGSVRVRRRGIWRTEIVRIDQGPRITRVWCKPVRNPAWEDKPERSTSSLPSSP